MTRSPSHPGRRQAAITAGWVAAGFEPVADEFERNFAERGEVGAAFAVVVDGEPVVDLWGGVADQSTERPWRRDTLQLVFSGTKGFVAVCLLLLVERGDLDLDAAVSRYWPEFAANGKDRVRVRDVVSHTARLPAVRTPLVERDMTDPQWLAALLAGQEQERDPRAAFIYHGMTFGWLCGELIRRVDGRTLGRFFAEEIAAPLELDVWIGLPAEHEQRVSRLHYGPRWGLNPIAAPERREHDELLGLIWDNPPIFPPDHIPWNTRAFHAAEIGAAGAIGTARSIARLYGCLARGGEIDGVRILAPETIELGRTQLSGGHDPLSDQPMAFGIGFQLQTERPRFGAPHDAFGHDGAGGSIHCAWPSHRTGISYAMNEMRDDPDGDPRSQTLLAALLTALEARERHDR
jgi:CubicO group peptidase (beta-lactamase class C family)